jgi:anti-sigma factor RsiW
MTTDATLKAEYERLVRLQTVVAKSVGKDRASDALRASIAGIAGPEAVAGASPAPRAARRFAWRQMVAAALIALFLGSSATYLLLQEDAASREVAAIVAGHQRALLAAAPVDVASSDRHTVKPWFDAKLALSPHIVDLAASGFPLIGGRVDVLKGQAVPVLVYRRRGHLISVVAVPAAGGKDDGTTSMTATRDGYGLRGWRGRDFAYYAIADLPPQELDEFVASWRKQAGTE